MLKKYFEIFKNSKTLQEYKEKLNKVCPSDWKEYEGQVKELQRLARESGVAYVPFIGKEVAKNKVEEVIK